MVETSEEHLSGEAQTARELALRGRDLWREGDRDAATGVWDDLVERFGASLDPGVRRCVAWALCVKADQLRRSERYQEALSTFEDVDARYGGDETAKVTSVVTGGLLGYVSALGRVGRQADGIRVCDELVARYGGSADAGTRANVARALALKARTLGDLGRPEEAWNVTDDLDQRYGDSSDPKIRQQVAQALYSKAETMEERGRGSDAMAVLEDLNVRFSGSDESTEVLLVATKGLRKQARMLDAEERHDEALALWRTVGSRTSDKASERHALGATALAGQAKELRVLGRYEEAMAVCDELTDRYDIDDRPEVERAVCGALWDKAQAAATLEREQLAIQTVDELLTRFSDPADILMVPEIAAALLFKVVVSLLRGQPDVALGSSKKLRTQLERLIEVAGVAGVQRYGEQLLRVAETFRAVAVRGQRPVSGSPASGSRHLVLLHLRAASAASRSRRRPFLTEAVLIDELLIPGIGETQDPQARVLAVTAQIQLLQTFVLLGRLRRSSKVLDDLASGGQPVADALQTISDRGLRETGSGNRVLAARALSIRVSTLAEMGEPAKARAALDEMTTLFGKDKSRGVRLAVWIARHVMIRRGRSSAEPRASR